MEHNVHKMLQFLHNNFLVALASMTLARYLLMWPVCPTLLVSYHYDTHSHVNECFHFVLINFLALYFTTHIYASERHKLEVFDFSTHDYKVQIEACQGSHW